ncbi:MAG: carboxypeptidase-like regulatory domain-containing protein [Planctomycetota bacterium]
MLHGTGYLACLLSEAARQELVLTGRATVPVFRDRYSMELRIATEWPGQVMERGKIRILFRPADGGPEHGSGPPAARFGGELKASPELRRAWLKHTMLVDLVPHPGMVWHLGRQFDLHELPGHGGIVRFAQPGIYRVRAHDERGYVAEARSEIRSHGGSELMLSFERGRSLELLVSSAGSEVVPGARVRLIRTDGEEEEDREMQSDERGVVKFGGLFPGDRLAVEVSARGFEELNRTLPAGAKRWKVVLRPIPTVEYELTVLEAVSRKPLSGVLAVLGDPALPVRKARSGESGTLRMPLYRDRQNRLELRLAGYLDYVEIFQPGLGSSTLVACHLVPEELEHQRRLGLVCVVEGRLSDAEGHPLRGQMLSLVHEGFLFQGLPDGSRTPSRMILTGSRAEEVLRAITDTNGRFRLLSSRAGAAAVHWYGHPDATRKVVLVNGKRVLVHF